ncbi:MAG: hypothetical protein ACLFR1_13660 [Spirochaetia bacterium]
MKTRKLISSIAKGMMMITAVIAVLACQPAAGTMVSGTAAKGPVNGATVEIYALSEDGTRGELLATVTAGTEGDFAADIGDYAGALAVVVTGGSYVDEASGETVTLGDSDELETLLASTEEPGSVAVTALTTIAAAQASANAADGLDTVIANANSDVADTFGLSEVDISSVIPSDMSEDATADSSSQQQYGAVQAGLTQVAEDNSLAPADVLDLVDAMAQDFEDGSFDGTDAAGNALDTALSITPEQAMNGLNTAIENFMNSSENKSGVNLSELGIDLPSVP